jgi:endonuclease-3
MRDQDIHIVIPILRQATRDFVTPIVTEMAQQTRDPFRVLIGTLLSLRTKDTTTAQVAPRLFALADTPDKILRLTPDQIAGVIYPVGFYRNKARTILEVCHQLIERYDGRVPDEIDELLTLPGVGRKTANLVVTVGYGKPGICVDTHVHRITNRWGYVQTKTPEETEMALRARLPDEYWIEINDLLVSWGQNVCHPTSPRCSVCPLRPYCDRVGVVRSR